MRAQCTQPQPRLRTTLPPQAMARPTYTAISTHAAGQRPVLVFVPTRKHARLAALDLLTHAAADGWGGEQGVAAPRRERYTCTSSRALREI